MNGTAHVAIITTPDWPVIIGAALLIGFAWYSRRVWKRSLVTTLVVTTVLAMAAPAMAARVVERPGSGYNGIANPAGCSIRVHNNAPSELHVGCAESDGKARIRYRFIPRSGYPADFRPARVSVQWDCHSPTCDPNAVTVSWRVRVPRTLRVIVNDSYVHIRSVRFFQAAG